MKKLSWLLKVIIPIVTLMIGLIVGLGVGKLQIQKEQKVFQDKLREASKKTAFLQKKMVEEKNEATASVEQRYQSNLDKLQNEKKALGEQVGKLKAQARNLEAKMEGDMKEQIHNLEAKMKEQAANLGAKIKQSDEGAARAKKELQEERQKYAQASQQNKELEREKERVTGETRALRAELEKTIRNVGRCEVNNARLCIIAEELVKAYRDKGVGAALLQKEPLTEIKKVELEQLAEKYRQEIEQQKLKKK
jgi:chromosome segregation ATPase